MFLLISRNQKLIHKKSQIFSLIKKDISYGRGGGERLRSQCGRTVVRFRSIRTQWRQQLATGVTFLGAGLPRR